MPAEGALPGAEPEPFKLIETLRWSLADGFVRLEPHLKRLADSAAVFGIPFHAETAFDCLGRSVAGDAVLRVRLVLHSDGRMTCGATPLIIEREWHCCISPQRVQSGDPMLRYKTSRRALWDGEQARVAALGLHEPIFLNERGEVTEGSRSNVFVRRGGRLLTPALRCGLLNGCLRQELIETSTCSEAVLFADNLVGAPELYLGNSLRGLIRAFCRPTG